MAVSLSWLPVSFVFLIVMANLCCGCRLNMHNTTMLKSPFVHSCCAPTTLPRPSLPSGQGLHHCPGIHNYLVSKVYTCCPGIVAKVYTSALIWPLLAHTQQCVAHLCCYILLCLLLLLLLLLHLYYYLTILPPLLLLHTADTNLYFHTQLLLLLLYVLQSVGDSESGSRSNA